jgi:hypothetical protein
MGIFKLLPVLAVLLAGLPAWAAPPNVEVAQVEVAQAPARDNAAELARLKPLADKGDAAAQFKVGVLYAENRNLFEAARYYRLAAARTIPRRSSAWHRSIATAWACRRIPASASGSTGSPPTPASPRLR